MPSQAPRVADRPRILLLPDSIHWIAGTIARAIAAHNPGFEFVTISEPVFRRVLRRLPDLPARFDAVHFLTPEPAARWGDCFPSGCARVVSVYHLEDGVWIDGVRACDAYMTISAQWTDALLAAGASPERIEQVSLGVDPTIFRPAVPGERERMRARLGLGSEAFVIGFCGKRSSDTSGRKGIDTFTHALKALARLNPRAACLIAGPGWEEYVRERRAEGLHCVHRPFAVGLEGIAPTYRALDLLWVTSRLEGGPAPLLEAMSSGVPCLSTRVGAALELVRDGENGRLLDFDDPRAFAEASAALAGDRATLAAFGREARATILAGRGWDRTAPAATRLYGKALARAADRVRSTDAIVPRAGPILSRRWLAWIEARENLGFALALSRVGEHAEAARLAARAVRSGPGDALLWWHWGRIAARRLLERERGRELASEHS